MRKSPDNYQTLQLHPQTQAIPLKSSTSHKVPYLPTLAFRFQDVILNRLNSESREESKSIFFLKGAFKRDHSRYRHRFHENYTEKIVREKQQVEMFPQVSVSTTLDTKEKSPKRKPLKKQKMEEDHEIGKNQIESINLYIKKRTSNHSHNPSQQTSMNRTQYRPRIIKLEHEKKQIKQQSKLDEMIIGNKTILNFRQLQSQCKRSKNKHNKNQLKVSNMYKDKNKIKFDTFFHPDKHDLSPWIFSDRFDEHS